eukprot:gene11747-20114_t
MYCIDIGKNKQSMDPFKELRQGKGTEVTSFDGTHLWGSVTPDKHFTSISQTLRLCPSTTPPAHIFLPLAS